MNKEQAQKYFKFRETNGANPYTSMEVWQACCDANGINTEEPVKDEASAAPEWVIDMIRTGKAVRCKVWDEIEYKTMNPKLNITGIQVVEGGMQYLDEDGYTWKHAEPIPAWQPQDGESVLYNAGTDIAGIGTYIKGRVYHGNQSFHVERSGARLKPYDGDETKIGKPWSEI